MLIIDHGHVIYDGDLQTIRRRFGGESVLVVDLDEPGPAIEVDGARVVKIDGPRQWLSFRRDDVTAADLIARVAARVPLRDLALEERRTSRTSFGASTRTGWVRERSAPGRASRPRRAADRIPPRRVVPRARRVLHGGAVVARSRGRPTRVREDGRAAPARRVPSGRAPQHASVPRRTCGARSTRSRTASSRCSSSRTSATDAGRRPGSWVTSSVCSKTLGRIWSTPAL